MTSILFLNRRFEIGGAERQLLSLAKGLRRVGLSVKVATFYSGGPLQKDLEEAGIPLFVLGKRTRWDLFGFLTRLICLVKELRPNLLHGYLSTANILSVLVKPLFPGMQIIWGVRASDMNLERYSVLERMQYWVECRLSRFADLIIVNSHAGFAHAVANGFPASKMVVIQNGIDVDRFCPDLETRNRLRKEWGIAQNDRLIGLVGRLDPMKDHETFLRAAASLAKERNDVHFVCVGNGRFDYKSRLQELGRQLGLEKRLIWIDSHEDMQAVYNAFDVATSSSLFGEGFSNVIGEAMACGRICVVTDVGDAKEIVGNTGYVVPPGNPEALASAWREALTKGETESMRSSRDRVVKYFGTGRLLQETMHALKKLDNADRRKSRCES